METFFEQWLDRTGAPELELQWTRSRTDRGGLVEGTIRQIQTGEPYHLFVTLALARSGSSRLKLILWAAGAIWLVVVLVFFRRWKTRGKSGPAAPAGSG